MKTRVRTLLTTVILTETGPARQRVAPTTEPVGSARGDNWSDYNIVSSFEPGYRVRTFGGSFDHDRSAVNFGDGVRPLSRFLTVNSRDGHGKFFDEVVLTTQGPGNDRYKSATFRVQKNRLYRYDMPWRVNGYCDPGSRAAGAQDLHLLDTTSTLQDHHLTLFPQANIKSFLGYSHANQNGPALARIQPFDSTANEFPLFENVLRVRNEYRLKSEVRLFRVRPNWTQGREDFKEDSTYQPGPKPGIVPHSLATLFSLQRQQPYHGTSAYWRIGLFAERKYFSANRRSTHTSSERGFLMDETALATTRFGAACDRQIVTAGNAQRPVLTADLTLSFLPISRITLINHTAVNHIRIDGNIFNLPFRQTNLLQSGVFGIRLESTKPLSIALDGEIDRANRPPTPIDDRNCQALDARLQSKAKSFRFAASTQANCNTNSVVLSTYASRACHYNGAAAWTPRNWLTLDVGHFKLDLNAAGGIAYFANAAQDTGDGRGSPLGPGIGSALPASDAVQTFPIAFLSAMARLSARTGKLRKNVGYQYHGYNKRFLNGEGYRAHTSFSSVLRSF